MKTVDFDISGWLERLEIAERPSVTLEGLKSLHQAQVYKIAFENLDILLDRKIELEPEHLQKKLIENRRGGYCFELNSLFMMGLVALGFSCTPLLGRVHLTGEPSGRGHALTLVNIEGEPWIADVGFGANGLRSPIPLIAELEHRQDGQVFQLVRDIQFEWMLQVKRDDAWQQLYSFDLTHVCTADLKMGNYYTSTHPDSRFTFMPTLTIPNSSGRNTLHGEHIHYDVKGKIKEVPWQSVEHLQEILDRDFHICMSLEEITRLLPKLKP